MAVGATFLFLEGLMNLRQLLALSACGALALFGARLHAADVLFISADSVTLPGYDAGYVAHLTSGGHTVTAITAANFNTAQQQAAALANDVVIISESIGSTAVSNAGVFNFATTPVPVINFEVFSWDEQKLTGTGNFVNLGNTGRPEAQPLGLDAMQDNIFITAPSHPLAGGFPAGSLQVYTQPYSVNFGIVGAGAQVAAAADAAGAYPTLFAYPAGATLVDNSLAPARWIGLYLGQAPAGNPASPGNPQFSFVNANGLALLDAALAYALIPEPVSAQMLLIAVGGLLAARRRSFANR